MNPHVHHNFGFIELMNPHVHHNVLLCCTVHIVLCCGICLFAFLVLKLLQCMFNENSKSGWSKYVHEKNKVGI